MEDFFEQVDHLVTQVQFNLDLVLHVLAFLLAIHIANQLLGRVLLVFGLWPRSFRGLFGIFFSPFLHGNFNHFFFNAIPLFALMHLVLLDGESTFYLVSGSIMLLSGVLTWCFGRKALHIGASGMILGYWSYCLCEIPEKGFVQAVVLGIVCLYQFGTLLMDLIPDDASTSWEGHVFGFIAGIVTAYHLPTLDRLMTELLLI